MKSSQLYQVLMIVSAVTVAGFGSFVLWRQTEKATATIASPNNPLLDGAIMAEAERIRSMAGSDPECSVLPGATDAMKVQCFLDRLSKENGEALAIAAFRAAALEKANEIGQGQGQ